MENNAAGKQDGHNTVASQCRDQNVEGENILPSSNEEATSNAEPASLSMGEVKICLICSSVLGGPVFYFPSHDQILKK